MPNKKVDKIKGLYQSLRTAERDQWLSINQQGYDFANDNQLSESEKKVLEEAGMPTFTINRITPVVEMLNYYATANSPKWQAIGSDGDDSDVAAVFSDMADYIWSLSNGQTLLSNAINDAITKSLGYLVVTIDKDADRGMGEVVLQQPDPFDVYVDPKSRDALFRDAAYIMIKKMLPREHLLNKFPDYKKKILSANASESEISLSRRSLDGERKDILQQDLNYAYKDDGSTDDLVEYFEYYERIRIPFVNVFYKKPLTPQQLKEAKARVQVKIQEMFQELQVQFIEQQRQMQQAVQSGEMLPQRFQLEIKKAEELMQKQLQDAHIKFMTEIQNEMSKVENKVISEKEFKEMMKSSKFAEMVTDTIRFHDTRVQISCVVGDKLLYEHIFPEKIKDYPIIPFNYKWIGTPYPISAVSPLVGKQRELNKAHQLMIHNASLGSSLRWMYYEGSIDTEVWEKYSSSPGALLPINHGYETPKEVSPSQLSNAFFTITGEGKRDMEYLAGIYSAMQGDTGATQDMPYRGMLAMDEYGTRRVKYWLKHSVEPSLVQIGKVIQQFSQAAYTAHKVFRVVQPGAIEENRIVEINKPLLNDLGNAVGRWNDYATANFDIRIVAGSTMPVNRWAYLQELKELLNAGVVDRTAVLAETDLRNKEKIEERLGQIQQLQSQIQQLEDDMSDKEGTIETLERQLVQLGIKDKVRQAEMEIEKNKHDLKTKNTKENLKTEAEQKVLRNSMQRDADERKRNMDLALENFKNSLQQQENKV